MASVLITRLYYGQFITSINQWSPNLRKNGSYDEFLDRFCRWVIQSKQLSAKGKHPSKMLTLQRATRQGRGSSKPGKRTPPLQTGPPCLAQAPRLPASKLSSLQSTSAARLIMWHVRVVSKTHPTSRMRLSALITQVKGLHRLVRQRKEAEAPETIPLKLADGPLPRSPSRRLHPEKGRCLLKEGPLLHLRTGLLSHQAGTSLPLAHLRQRPLSQDSLQPPRLTRKGQLL